jgi:sulfatase modifying factor 1
MGSYIRSIFSLVSVFAARAALAITVQTVPVGDLGNPNDPANGNFYGAVSYAYNIGKYGVTVGQYAAFLNAVAATDKYDLYSQSMASDLNIAGIARSGSSGSYSYSIIGSANHPIAYVNWGNAARFANWLNNGQPTGSEGPGTTETGAYTLNGATTNGALMLVRRNANATWFIPTENEWYKAAYYQPAAAGGDSDGYWLYPMKTNTTPYSAPPPGSSAPDPTRVGNFLYNGGITNGYDHGLAVTASTSYSSSQNYLTDVGAYSSSPTYYGTFDQGANVREWCETAFGGDISGVQRVTRGGSWIEPSDYLQASTNRQQWPLDAGSSIGFRVASSIPEPGCATLCVAGLVMFAARRRERRPDC